MEITLDRLLASKDNRKAKHAELMQNHPDLTLMCLTVIIPGNVKRNLYSLTIAQAAVGEIINTFDSAMCSMSVSDLDTGYEAYVLTSLSREQAKRMACEIEDSHQLGRLFDIDVILPNGEPMPRTAIGLKPRKCLLCDNEARYCMRNRSHTSQEIQQHIIEMVEQYVR